MPDLLHQLSETQALHHPDRTALLHKDEVYTYRDLQAGVDAVAAGLLALGIAAGDRVATYLPKQVENVFGLFGASAAGACFVPINPLLKARQVAYILRDCNVRVLITSSQRLDLLREVLDQCPDLLALVTVDSVEGESVGKGQIPVLDYRTFSTASPATPAHRRIDSDMAAILYTSGSTGAPKGVILSHRNMVAGARSVASYLGNTASDRILAVLPLSFDAGLSQLTTAFAVGASVVLMDYLLPRDVIRTAARHQVSGLTAVPPLWNQLAGLEWPPEVARSLRYIANTGGAMPVPTTRSLQQSLPDTDIYLMYGLTEAFRSTYLPPDQVQKRPESIGKAIPNAEILVINEQGERCAPGEPGELVHRGALVALGYWNDPVKTAERFKPSPIQEPGIPLTELAVWSGDQVTCDEEGYLYFVSRKDEMIKTSGYRVSPTEVESEAFASGLVASAAALGLPHQGLGQAILLAFVPAVHAAAESVEADLLQHLRRELPNFMVPQRLVQRDSLPHNQNGKIDRRALALEYHNSFTEDPA